LLQATPCHFHLIDKPSPQTGLLHFVPQGRRRKVCFDLGPDFQPPTHLPISFLSRPSTSLAESDEEGSFRWASNRVSASFSSSVVKPWSSNSITRRTNACRSWGFQFGSSWSTSVTLIFLSMFLRDGSWANDVKLFVTRSHSPHLQNAPQAQGSIPWPCLTSLGDVCPLPHLAGCVLLPR